MGKAEFAGGKAGKLFKNPGKIILAVKVGQIAGFF
jgi:hypothetical protein